MIGNLHYEKCCSTLNIFAIIYIIIPLKDDRNLDSYSFEEL